MIYQVSWVYPDTFQEFVEMTEAEREQAASGLAQSVSYSVAMMV